MKKYYIRFLPCSFRYRCVSGRRPEIITYFHVMFVKTNIIVFVKRVAVSTKMVAAFS